MALTKPPVLPAWAEAGDKVQPSNAEIQAGWPLSSVPPARQRWNWLLNFLANGVRYLTRRGIADWGSDETYEIGDRVQGPDGLTYKALTQNTNKTPASNPSDWTRWGFTASELGTELNKLDYKDSCRVATTANLAALSGLLTIDGVVLVAGDRVLVKDQAAGSQNGIYVAEVGAWARAADADDGAKLNSGAIVPVEVGTVNGDTIWMLTTDGAITIGVKSLAFSNIQGNVGTPGTYNSVTTDAKGRAVSGTYINYLRKNAVINGDGRVRQGAAVNISASRQYGLADGWLINLSSGTVSAGLVTAGPGTLGITKTSVAVTGLTCTGSGVVDFVTRIPSEDSVRFNNQTVTVSFLVAHDVGVSINWQGFLRKANATDNFGAVTNLASSGVFPTAGGTRVWLTTTLGNTDASNGLELLLQANCGAVTNKNFYVSEVQIETGSVITEFEVVPYQQALAICQRQYYRESNATGYFRYSFIHCQSTTVQNAVKHLPVPMRSIPAVSYSNLIIAVGSATTAVTGLIVDYFGGNTIALSLTSAAIGAAGNTGLLEANNGASYLVFDARI